MFWLSNAVRNSSFGELAFVTNVPMTIGDPNLQRALNPGGRYELVLDMQKQVVGLSDPGEDVTIIVRRMGADLVIDVDAAGTSMDGTYYRAPLANLRSLTIRGSNDRETFRFTGDLGINDIRVVGRDGDDTLDLDLANGDPIGTIFTFDGSAGVNKVRAAGDVDYTLTDISLEVPRIGKVHLLGGSVTEAELTGGAGNNRFTVSGWSQLANLDGQGASDTVASENDADFTLTQTQLIRSVPGTINLTSIEDADLTGGPGRNVFTVTAWTGTGRLNGSRGPGADEDEIVATNDTNVTLSDTYFLRSTAGRLDLVSIERATLAGGASDNLFHFDAWKGHATVDGVGDDNRLIVDTGSDMSLSMESIDTFEILGGTVDLVNNATVTALMISDGELKGTTSLVVTNSTNWTGGTISGTGLIILGGTAGISGNRVKRLHDRRLRNGGILTWTDTGAIPMGGTSVIENLGTFNVLNNANIQSSAGTPTFVNEGTFIKKDSTGVTGFSVIEVRNEGGTFTITTGEIALAGFGGTYTQTGGNTKVADNARFRSPINPLRIEAGALEGSGRIIGTVISSGQVKPGDSPGRLTITREYTQQALGEFEVELANPTAGSGHDQLVVGGTVSLSGTLSAIGLPGFTGNRFVIISNTGADAVVGTFNGLPENALVLVAGRQFRISYEGGDGNDVVLFTPPNQPPVLDPIGNQIGYVGAPLTFTATGSDPLDVPPDALTFSLIGAPAGAAIDPDSGVFTWAPTREQGDASYTFTVRVTDDGSPNLYDEESITVTVFSWVAFTENTASFAYVSGPGSPPLGSGSFQMLSGSGTGTNLGGKVYLVTLGYNGVPLSSLTAFTYSTYVAVAGTPNLSPYLNVYLDLNDDGIWSPAVDDKLVFEATYQGASNPVQQNTWQTWDAHAGQWWGFYGNAAGLPVAGLKTIPQILATFPNARIVSPFGAYYPGVLILVGQASGGIWANFDGNVDNVTIGVGSKGFIYDFEATGVTLTDPPLDGGMSASSALGAADGELLASVLTDPSALLILAQEGPGEYWQNQIRAQGASRGQGKSDRERAPFGWVPRGPSSNFAAHPSQGKRRSHPGDEIDSLMLHELFASGHLF